jgi:hypothetical protein
LAIISRFVAEKVTHLFLNTLIFRCNNTKGGHPQYCGQPKRLRTSKSCGTAIADLQNLTSAIPQLSAVSGQFSYFLVPFPQLRMFLKINQK